MVKRWQGWHSVALPSAGEKGMESSVRPIRAVQESLAPIGVVHGLVPWRSRAPPSEPARVPRGPRPARVGALLPRRLERGRRHHP
ncbi:hypothetical protein PR202_gb00052 [Eleusine coracana subsp. coracana]|uniref:Uncharacterized protein n=1 Tax=Eleusine coracana subsp. coracana TaxID=191504 RepID=A0AAV5DSR0_ELECO|nr:hypothetical protein PR202_gb00052 [Eleusine coracana subsp. coracana]